MTIIGSAEPRTGERLADPRIGERFRNSKIFSVTNIGAMHKRYEEQRGRESETK